MVGFEMVQLPLSTTYVNGRSPKTQSGASSNPALDVAEFYSLGQSLKRVTSRNELLPNEALVANIKQSLHDWG